MKRFLFSLILAFIVAQSAQGAASSGVKVSPLASPLDFTATKTRSIPASRHAEPPPVDPWAFIFAQSWGIVWH